MPSTAPAAISFSGIAVVFFAAVIGMGAPYPNPTGPPWKVPCPQTGGPQRGGGIYGPHAGIGMLIAGMGPHMGGGQGRGAQAITGRQDLFGGQSNPPTKESTTLNGNAIAAAASFTVERRKSAKGLESHLGPHRGGGQGMGPHIGGGHIAGPHICGGHMGGGHAGPPAETGIAARIIRRPTRTLNPAVYFFIGYSSHNGARPPVRTISGLNARPEFT